MSVRPSPVPASGAPSSARLDGKYELIRCLGKGGMGEVWEAEHAKLGRRVAIKFIHAEAAKHAETLKRFQNEARASAKLQSRFIVQVIDDGVDQDGRPYIVMEKLIGESLGDRIERLGRIEVEALRLILRDVSRGLAVAHDAGIVHRDLKPDNIFLHKGPDDDHETAKLVDFGIAKIAEGALGSNHSTTQTGSLLGTPLYMSPEQARGAKPIDARTDTWSLGVVAYECLTGDVPFHGSTVGDIAIHICLSEHEAPSVRNSALLPTLDSWMSRALAKDKQYRFATSNEMYAAFERALAGESIALPPPAARSHYNIPVTGDSDTLDLVGQAETVSRRPVAPLPRVREVSDSSISGAASEERPLTLGPVASRPEPAKHSLSRGFLAGAVFGLVGLAAVGLSMARSKGEGVSSAATNQASQALSAQVAGSAREPANSAANPPANPTAPPISASAQASPPPPSASAARPPGARPPGAGKRKGTEGAGGVDELGY